MTKTELNRALYALRDASRLPDPGPAVNVPITPRTMADVTEAQAAPRMANRPPDAAIPREDQVDVLGRGIEMLAEKLKARDETIAAQTQIIEDETAMKRRATYTAALLFGLLCWRDGWWIAKWIWGLL